MRLLNARNMKFEEFLQDKPPYAILSHTWGDEEVSYQDMLGTEYKKKKKGYQKIMWCCEQALRDGHEYAWVDTCCIDKASSAELTQAINSMFNWYAEARVCYAYLSDIHWEHDEATFIDKFQRSRWFTRGWTLQELIAPRDLVFFSSGWKAFGSRKKHPWIEAIRHVTNIPDFALTGFPGGARLYSVAQKMSWASRRETTRKEDLSYCLMGIFDVNMPLLYGEGGMKAFHRLQEEIIKDSDDQSIFSWSDLPLFMDGKLVYPVQGAPLLGPLASAPSLFEQCGSIVPMKARTNTEPYSITNSGLKITGLVCSSFNFSSNWISTNGSSPLCWPDHLILLNCACESDQDTVYGIPLRILHPDGNQFARVAGPLIELRLGVDTSSEFSHQTIYIRKRPRISTVYFRKREKSRDSTFEVRLSPSAGYSLRVREVVPPGQHEDLEGEAGISIFPAKLDPVQVHFNHFSWRVSVLLERKSHQGTYLFVLVLGYYPSLTGYYWATTSFPSEERGSSQEYWNLTSFQYSGIFDQLSLCFGNGSELRKTSDNDSDKVEVTISVKPRLEDAVTST